MCDKCPWYIFVSDDCDSGGKGRYKRLYDYGYRELKSGVDKRWTKKRIKELTEWSELIQKEIDSRK